MPAISIITTVYDAKDYLPLTVQSILAQSFADFELILVEDGSPNGCGELCDELARTDPRIRVVHKKNGGPASAANAGLDAATGDYISYVDSDDLLHPDFLKTLYNTVKESGCPLAACGAVCIDEKGNFLERGVTLPEEFLGRHDALEQFLDVFKNGGMYSMVTWNKLYDTRLFANVRHDETMFYGDDANIMDKIYDGNEIVLSNEPLYYYRTRTGSMTALAFSAKRLDDLRLYGGWVDFFAGKPGYEDLSAWAVARYWQVFYLFYVHANLAGPMPAELKQGFAAHKKKLNKLLPRILSNPHVPGFEKLRAVLFCVSPALCYKLAAARGKMDREKEA